KHRDAVANPGVIHPMALPISKVNARLCQDAFIRGHPSKSKLRHDTGDVIRYRSLRWPQAIRIPAKALVHELARPAKLLDSIFRKAEFDRHIPIVHPAVDKQRKNRM